MSADGKNERSRVARWLAHPLLLLAVGAVFTWFFGSYLTQRWQDQQQKLDDQRAEVLIKTQLIQRITQVSEEELTSIQSTWRAYQVYGERGWQAAAPALVAASRRWPQDSAEVDAKLRAWFPPRPSGTAAAATDPQSIVGRWTIFESQVNSARGRLIVPTLPWEHPSARSLRTALSRITEELVDSRHVDPQWDSARSLPLDSLTGHGTFVTSAYLVSELRDARDRLLRVVLATKPTGFR